MPHPADGAHDATLPAPAIKSLPDIAHEKLSSADRRTVTASVQDESGCVLYSAVLTMLIAASEAAIRELQRELNQVDRVLSVWLVEAMWHAIRIHRAGIIKNRAVMGAPGIDV